jgi:hypothetical protein
MNGLDQYPMVKSQSLPYPITSAILIMNNSNLDLIEINLTQPLNIQGQPENHFFDPAQPWQKIGIFKPEISFN